MKFYSNQITNIVSAIRAGKIHAVLFYGPDHGLAQYCTQQLTKLLGFDRRNLCYDDVTTQDVRGFLSNINLFGNKELICVTESPSAPDSHFKDMMQKEHHHFLTLTAGELSTSSSLRKIFETEGNLAAVACYNDNEQDIEKIIRTKLFEEKKTISEDALKFLKHNLHGDRFLIINELEKLCCYSVKKTTITLDDVIDIICCDATNDPDMLSLYFMAGNYNGYFQELNKVLGSNISAIWVIRAIIRYHISAYIVLSKVKEGQNIDVAIEQLTPKMFFKYKPIFKAAVQKMDYDSLMKRLGSLYLAEKECKSGTIPHEQICAGLALSMSS